MRKINGLAAILGGTLAIAVVMIGSQIKATTVVPSKSTPSPVVSHTVSPSTISEDDPNWNCLTMGNKICGPTWETIKLHSTTELALKNSEDATQDWSKCLIHFDDTTTIVCPDGKVYHS